MKKTITLFLLFITLFSCKDENVERLKQENEQLQKQLNEKQKNTIKYTLTAIYYKMGDVEGDYNGQRLTNIRNKAIYSDIIEVENFDRTIELKLQDQLEKELRRLHQMFIHSLQKRETFVFDTYEEASEFKFKITNK